MVLGEVGRLVVAGLALGVAGAVAGTRLLETLLYGVTPSDPATLAVAVTTLAAVAFAAGAIPAWRAARLDPVRTLRQK
jgi:ABC-type antimicrobial peptide transport system permease subunit